MLWVDVAQYVWPVECTAFSLSQGYDVIAEVSGSVIRYGEARISLMLEESVDEGFYSLTCTLTPDSCIFGYHVWEWEGEHDEATDYNR
jgi:hypothetical protein